MSESDLASLSMTPYRIEIGRLALEVGLAEGRLIETGAANGASHDGGYVLMVPLTGSVRFHQSGRIGLALPDQYC